MLKITITGARGVGKTTVLNKIRTNLSKDYGVVIDEKTDSLYVTTLNSNPLIREAVLGYCKRHGARAARNLLHQFGVTSALELKPNQLDLAYIVFTESNLSNEDNN